MRDLFAAHAAAPVPRAVQVFLGGIADWFIFHLMAFMAHLDYDY
jgi:hypothetical protein